MKKRLLFVAGLATGYVAGSRAGRSAYTALTERLRTIRSSDAVQSAVGSVTQAVQEKAPGLTAAVSKVAETTSSVAETTSAVVEAAASAPDPEQDAEQDASASAEGTGSASSASEETAAESSAPSGTDDSAPEPTNQKPKRASRSKSTSSGAPVESAEEAAKVFEELLPESGGAIDDAASSIATEQGQADEAEHPTATS